MARKITAADGTEWKVGREWLPWRVNLRRESPDLGVADTLGGFDDLAGIFLAIALAILLFVAIVLGWFLIALVIELLVLLVGFLAGLLARTLLRRPWTVRARSRRGEDHRWQVRGWRASGTLMDEVASALEGRQALPAGAVSRAARAPERDSVAG